MKNKFDKKIFAIGCGAGIALAFIICVILLFVIMPTLKKNNKNTPINGTVNETGQTQSGDSQNATDETATTKEKLPVLASIDFIETNSWQNNSYTNRQFNMTVKNVSDKDISDWKVELFSNTGLKIEQNWNCNAELDGSDNAQSLVITPVDYNKSISKGQENKDIGFIIGFLGDSAFDSYKLYVTTSDNNTYIYDSTGNSNGDNSNKDSTPSKDAGSSDNAGSPDNSGASDGGSSNQGDSGDKGGSGDDALPAGDGEKPTMATGAGQLHVSGTSLADASGKKVVLRGVSTHGLAWYPQYVNYDSFKSLRDDWGSNVVRLAMYTAEYGGYCSGGDKAALKQLVDNGVNYATQLGMYVIIDWHILQDGNPNTNKSEAISFFDEIAKKYSDHTNVLYEICNEPQNSDWNSVIKPYAEELVSTIRKHDSDAVIIVGTNTWSQDVDAVVDNMIDDDNVMYALHFYASTHKDNIRNKLKTALDGGVPVFVSECSITEASGGGNIDYDSANEWLSLLNERGVSFVAWSLSNKNEASALINPGCSKLSGWSESDLSATGKWFRTAIKGK